MTAINFAALYSFAGNGKAKREKAFASIADYSFTSETSRVALIAAMRDTLNGDVTNEPLIASMKTLYVAGRVAARLPKAEVPKGTNDLLEHAFNLVTRYGACPKEGTKARALKAGQLGRRSAVQERIVRNAQEAWSQVAAELELGKAKTQKARNDAKKTRAPKTGARGEENAATNAKPKHSELVKKPVAMNENDACDYVEQQATMLLAFGNKNATVLRAAYGTAIQAFKTAINKAANERQVAKAIAEAAGK